MVWSTTIFKKYESFENERSEWQTKMSPRIYLFWRKLYCKHIFRLKTGGTEDGGTVRYEGLEGDVEIINSTGAPGEAGKETAPNSDSFTVDDAVEYLGFGKFQLKLSLLTGLAWVSLFYYRTERIILLFPKTLILFCSLFCAFSKQNWTQMPEAKRKEESILTC